MKAIGYFATGPPNVLTDIEVATPTAGPSDLLVAVRAISVNPVDTKVRRRKTPPTGEPWVLGYDAAGVVEDVGEEVTLFQRGDEVFYAGTSGRQGTNAEYHAVDERLVGPKPPSLSFADAAALPLTSITAWELLFDRMRIPRSQGGAPETLLVLAGAGGVGSILIQFARALTNLTVIGTASRPESVAWVKQMGAHHVVNHHRPIPEAVRECDIAQVDYLAALTTTTPGRITELAEIAAPQSTVGFIDDLGDGASAFKAKSITLCWESMFTRSLFETADMAAQHAILVEVSRMVDAGALRTTATHNAGRINAENLRSAHALVESGKSIGKTVLAGF
ncbi:MAG TPA: zinc-binding alcohol dehydrogenase family protein [Vicinamibacterales bacterium]|nr:zinc-binding alcohol dehydrogenase family protein [Vicinamibacterales bacterium]